MTFPSIQVIAGEDPNILDIQSGDPSGFEQEGFSRETLQDLCDLVAREYQFVMEQGVPDALLAQAPVIVPIYAQRGAEELAASTSYGNPVIQVRSTGETHSLSLPRSAFRHMSLRAKPSDLSDPKKIRDICHKTGHECIHLLTNYISPFMRGPMEALVLGMDQQLYPDQEDHHGNAKLHGWTREGIKSTDGFAPPDNAYIDFRGDATGALYASAAIAMHDVEPRALWKIWEMLERKTGASNCYALLLDIHESIRETLGDAAVSILESPAFRLMQKEGNQFVSFQNPTRTKALAFATYNERIPSYGQANGDGLNLTSMIAHARREPVAYVRKFFNRKGEDIRTFKGNGQMLHSLYWNVKTITDEISTKIPGNSITKDIGKITTWIDGVDESISVQDENYIRSMKALKKKKR